MTYRIERESDGRYAVRWTDPRYGAVEAGGFEERIEAERWARHNWPMPPLQRTRAGNLVPQDVAR